MLHSLCQSCQSVLRLKLQRRISILQNARRNKSTSNPPIQSWYWDTQPPNDRQLASAAWFFRNHPPQLLWTAKEWLKRRKDENTSDLIPEVVFLGRSNVGKSSLLNALVRDPDLNRVGARPGLTTVMRAYSLSMDGKRDRKRPLPPNARPGQLLTILDAPGYGHASRTEWGAEIVKYLQERKNLRRVFLLIDSMHGAKPADLQMLGLLQENAISHQIIATKCDRFSPHSRRADLLTRALARIYRSMSLQNPRSTFTGLGEMIVVGSLGSDRAREPVNFDQTQGVSAVQFAVLRSVGLDEYAYGLFKDLEEAQKFDDSPRKPTLMRMPTPEIDTPSQSDPIPTLTPSASSIREPLPTATSQKTSHSSSHQLFEQPTSQTSPIASTQTFDLEQARKPTSKGVSRGFSAFLDAVNDPKSPARAQNPTTSKPSRNRDRTELLRNLAASRRIPKFFGSPQVSFRPSNDLDRAQGRIERRPKLSENPRIHLPKNMQDLLTISEWKNKKGGGVVGSTAEKREKSRHANPFQP